MKKWLETLWAKIKKPIKWIALIALAALYVFSIIDALVRCFQGRIFAGIVQIYVCIAAFPFMFVLGQALIVENKEEEDA